jgi:hypothetical protein
MHYLLRHRDHLGKWLAPRNVRDDAFEYRLGKRQLPVCPSTST